MNSIVLILFDKRKRVSEVKSYGSIVSMLANENLTLEGKPLGKRMVYYRLEDSDILIADNCHIQKTTINRTK